MPKFTIAQLSKLLFFLLFALATLNSAYAQNRDSLFFFAVDGSRVQNLDSAYFIRSISIAPDSVNLYDIHEYYKNGQLKRIGKSKIKQFTFLNGEISLDGQFIQYYPNGKKRVLGAYKNGWLSGFITYYYPSGKIYCVKQYNDRNYLHESENIDCYDPQGDPICRNGNGYWFDYYPGCERLRLEGKVQNGLAEGVWQGHLIDPLAITSISRFQISYKNGIVERIDSFDNAGVPRKVKKHYSYPFYKGDIVVFMNRVRKELSTQTKIDLSNLSLSFIVGKDGALKNIHVREAGDADLNTVAAEIINHQKSWEPGTYLGFNMPYKIIIPLKYIKGKNGEQIAVTEEMLGDNLQSFSFDVPDTY